MIIEQGIEKAKASYNWNFVQGEPSVALIQFKDRNRRDEETELDLYTDDPEMELCELWKSLREELNADLDSVQLVSLTGMGKS